MRRPPTLSTPSSAAAAPARRATPTERAQDPPGMSCAVARPDGQVRCWAVGVDAAGAALGPGRWAALFCAGKPLVALAVLALVTRGDLSTGTAVGDVLSGPDLSVDVARARLVDLLAHRSDLGRAGALATRLMPWAVRRAHCRGLLRSPEAAREPAFVDMETWFLLGEVLEVVTGLDVDEAVAALVLDPYGVDRDDVAVWVQRSDPGWTGRVALSARDVGDRVVCGLAEITPELAGEWNPAFGSYATPRALVGVGLGVLADRAGAGRVVDPGLARACSEAQARTPWDPTLQRPAAFGLGFMVDLHELAPSWPPGTFGHTSQGAQVTWLVHPDLGSAVAHVPIAHHGVEAVRARLHAVAAMLAGALS